MKTYYQEPDVYRLEPRPAEAVEKDTAWSGLNVPRRSNRSSWSAYSNSSAAAEDTSRTEDYTNGNRLDNQRSAKRDTDTGDRQTTDTWEGINVPRRTGTVGSIWKSSSTGETGTIGIPDNNGNHVRQMEAARSRGSVTGSGTEETEKQISVRHGRQSESSRMSQENSQAWGGINVPRRCNRVNSGTPTLSQGTPQRSDGETGWHSDSNSRTSHESKLSVGHGPKAETMSGIKHDRFNQASGSVSDKDNESDSSPPRKQHKVRVENVKERIKTASAERQIESDFSLSSKRPSNHEDIGNGGGNHEKETAQSWGALNVHRRSSGIRYGSSSFTSRQQHQVDERETAQRIVEKASDENKESDPRKAYGGRLYSAVSPDTAVQSEVSSRDSDACDESSGGVQITSYYERYRSSVPVKTQRIVHRQTVQQVSEATSGTWDEIRPGLSDTSFAATSSLQRQHDQNSTTYTNKNSLIPPSETNSGGSFQIQSLRRSISPSSSQNETRISHRGPRDTDTTFQESKTLQQPAQQAEVMDKESEEEKESWGGIDVPRRSRLAGSYIAPKSPSRLDDTTNTDQESGSVYQSVESRPENTSSSRDALTTIAFPRRASESSVHFHRDTFREDKTAEDSDADVEQENSETCEAKGGNLLDLSLSRVGNLRRSGSLKSSRSTTSSSQDIIDNLNWPSSTLPRRLTHRSSSYSSGLRYASSPEKYLSREDAYSGSKSVTWSQSPAARRTSASEIIPIIRSRSHSRDNIRRRSSLTETPPQTERSSKLGRSKSFTGGSRRSVSPRKPRERSSDSPSKSNTYQVEKSSPHLNWTWTPASPLHSNKRDSKSDEQDDIFKAWSKVTVRRRSYGGSRPSDTNRFSDADGTSWSGKDVPRRSASTHRLSSIISGKKENQGSDEGQSKFTPLVKPERYYQRRSSDIPQHNISHNYQHEIHEETTTSEEKQNTSAETKSSAADSSATKWFLLEENRKRLSSSHVTAWELGRSQLVDFSPLTSNRDFVSPWAREETEPPPEGNWGGIEVPRRCIGYRSRRKSHGEVSGKAALFLSDQEKIVERKKRVIVIVVFVHVTLTPPLQHCSLQTHRPPHHHCWAGGPRTPSPVTTA